MRDLSTFDAVRRYVETDVFATAASVVADCGYHVPTALIVAAPMIIVMDDDSPNFDDRDKARFEAAIQNAAHRMRASSVILITEAVVTYSPAPTVELDVQASRDPRWQRILMLIVDHRDGQLHYHVPFREDGSLAPIGEPRRERGYGRFTNLLGLKLPTTPEA